jgi:hypothetical protein
MKKLFGFFDRERETLKGRVLIHFLEDDQVVPQIEWHAGQMGDEDCIRLILFYYARIMFELAELNETRVARELMQFVSQISGRLANPAGSAGKMQIPLGKLRLGEDLSQPSNRIYQASLFAKSSGAYRLEFESIIGREKFYLPASFLVLLQYGIRHIRENHLEQLARGLARLNQYYRYKRDFWNSAALTEGPSFALGKETITEPDPEIDAT